MEWYLLFIRFLILVPDCSRRGFSSPSQISYTFAHHTNLLQYPATDWSYTCLDFHSPVYSILLTAFILAASLPFVLRKPIKIDQSTPFVIEHKYITIRMQDEVVDTETTKISGTVTWNQGGVGVDQAVVYLFRVDHQARELVEASRTYTDQQGRFEMLTPAGLEVQIFVDPKEAKNVTAELKGRKEKEVTSEDRKW